MAYPYILIYMTNSYHSSSTFRYSHFFPWNARFDFGAFFKSSFWLLQFGPTLYFRPAPCFPFSSAYAIYNFELKFCCVACLFHNYYCKIHNLPTLKNHCWYNHWQTWTECMPFFNLCYLITFNNTKNVYVTLCNFINYSNMLQHIFIISDVTGIPNLI